MSLHDGMILYHGSYSVVRSIDLARCKAGKDYGRGFYTTTSRDQARAFIHTSLRKAKRQGDAALDTTGGYVSAFRYHAPTPAIPLYEFLSAGRDWLWFVARNRRSDLASLFNPHLPRKLFEAHIVMGKIANDTTNRVIAAYLDGLLGPVESESAVRSAVSQLMPERLQDQICFLTQYAIDCLEFVEAYRYE